MGKILEVDKLKEEIKYTKAIKLSEKIYEKLEGKKLDEDIKIVVLALLKGFEKGVNNCDPITLQRASNFFVDIMCLAKNSGNFEDYVDNLIDYSTRLEQARIKSKSPIPRKKNFMMGG